VIALWRRRAGSSRDEFRRQFMAAKAPILLPEGRYSGFERCIAEPAPGEADAIYDGVEQLWWSGQNDFSTDIASLSERGDYRFVDRAHSTVAKVEELYMYWPEESA
jgi:hypothetical protein